MEEKRPISRAEFQVSNGDALPCRGCGMIPAPQVWAAQWLPPRGLGGRGKRAPSQGRNLAHHAQGPPSGADTSQTAVAMPDGRTPGEVKPAVKAFQNQPVSPKHKGTGNAGFHGQEGRTSGVDEQHESLGKCWATFFMTCKYSRLSCVWNVVISSMFWQRWGVTSTSGSQHTRYWNSVSLMCYTRAHRSNPAHGLFLYGLWAGSYIFKWLKKDFKGRIFCDMWKYMKLKFVSINTVLLEHSHTHSLL